MYQVSVDAPTVIVAYLDGTTDLWGEAAQELAIVLRQYGVGVEVRGGWWYAETDVLEVY